MLASGKLFEKWQSTYDEKTRQFDNKSMLKAPIGMNAIGRAVAVAGHIVGNPKRRVKGMVVNTTCTGWKINKDTLSEKLQREAHDKGDNDEAVQLHLVMYEDGTAHWENLLALEGQYTCKWMTIE